MLKTIVPLLFLTLSSCHTTARWFESDLDEQVKPGSNNLSEDDLTEINPKILSLQLQYGSFPPKNRMYTSRHNIHCYQDGALKDCSLRLMLKNAPYLSEPMHLSRDLSLKIIALFKMDNPFIKNERQIFGDLVCDHLSNETPPFDKESVFCRIMNARVFNELIMTTKLAEDLMASFTNGAANTKRLPEMKLECNDTTHNEKLCRFRNPAIPIKDLTEEQWQLISSDLSATLFNAWEVAYLQHWSVENGKNKREIPQVKNLTGDLKCTILENKSKSNYWCSLRF